MGGERDPSESDSGRRGHVLVVPAASASLPAAKAEAQEAGQNAKINARRVAEEEAASPNENGKKKGMRSRLARWIHKLGSSSR
jgi:hypothetical protein